MPRRIVSIILYCMSCICQSERLPIVSARAIARKSVGSAASILDGMVLFICGLMANERDRCDIGKMYGTFMSCTIRCIECRAQK